GRATSLPVLGSLLSVASGTSTSLPSMVSLTGGFFRREAAFWSRSTTWSSNTTETRPGVSLMGGNPWFGGLVPPGPVRAGGGKATSEPVPPTGRLAGVRLSLPPCGRGSQAISLPPCGGGSGWGVRVSITVLALPPTLTLPHKGGG